MIECSVMCDHIVTEKADLRRKPVAQAFHSITTVT